MNLARTYLPVPVSPRIRTGSSVEAAIKASSKMFFREPITRSMGILNLNF
jgi:hypothetical protein